MSQAPATLDPWRLVWGQPYIDSRTLAAAIEQDLAINAQPDFRTRLLVRDAAVALRSYWGSRRFERWLAASPVGQRIRAITEEDLGATGFHAIEKRLVDPIDSRLLYHIFDLLGSAIRTPVEIDVTGSIPTLIKGLTARPTGDINLAGEVPRVIRNQRDLLQRIRFQFGMTIVKVYPDYLPAHWRERRQWFGEFGGLRVYFVDEYDIFVSKLPSREKKHGLDLRVLSLKLDKETARLRLLTDGRALLDDPKLRPQIEEHWRFDFQEPLFAGAEREQPGPAGETNEAT
jgi:hypothetical protein